MVGASSWGGRGKGGGDEGVGHSLGGVGGHAAFVMMLDYRNYSILCCSRLMCPNYFHCLYMPGAELDQK